MRDYRKKVSEKEPEYKAYVCNRYASGGKNACSSHYINQKVLTQIVMTDIRCKAMWAQNSRETLKMQLLAREQNASAERTRTLQAELNAIGKRLPELDKLIQSAYEDKVLGRIPESVCMNLLKHGRRRWVRCLQLAVDQYRAEVDNDRFKQQVRCQHHNIKAAEDQNIAVYLEKAFSPDELYQSQNGKAKGNSDRNQSQPIRQCVERPTCVRLRVTFCGSACYLPIS